MKKLFFVFQSILLFAGARSSWAQAAYDGGTNVQSPQVWNFMKYSHLNSVDNYTGTVFVRIPLYQYKDNDFDISISIDYASSGYMPNMQTGILGLGWILNVGGCITREVRGFADDEHVTRYTFPMRGYVRHHLEPNTAPPNWNDIIDFNYDYPALSNTFCFPYGIQSKSMVETSSDIYHFKFGEHRGSFVLGPNKTISVFDTAKPSGEYTIDMTELESRYRIRITTSDGYRYSFNSFNGLDHVYSNDSKPNINYSLTWLLETIEAPNGRRVQFTYSEVKKFDLRRPTAYLEIKDSESSQSGWLPSYNKYSSYNDESTLTSAYQYGKNLEQITIDNKLKIQFGYEDKRQEKAVWSTYGSIHLENVVNLGQLKNIGIIAIDGDTLRNCKFEYNKDVVTTGNPITFLKTLIINTEEKYNFSYHNESTPFPYYGTVDFDHWGYNNKTSDYNYNLERLIPNLGLDIQYNEKILSVQREPNASGAMMGMIKRIIYPTGGYTEFEYEGNSYSSKVSRNLMTQGNPALVSNSMGGFPYSDLYNYPAGGVRIKSMAHFDHNELCLEQKSYSYVDDDGHSTGILYRYPRYLDGVTIQYPYGYSNIFRRSGTNLLPISDDKSHVGYSKVREKNSDGSYVDYIYTNYTDTPDEMGKDLVRPFIFASQQAEVTFPQYAVNFNRKSISKHRLRGLLSRKLIYNNQESLVEKRIYSYHHVPKYAESLETMWGYSYVYKLLVGDIHKDEEISVTYFPNRDSLQTKKEYVYNDQGQITEERTKSPQGKKLVRRTIFPQEISGNADYAYITSSDYWQAMHATNYISTPLIEAQYVDSNLTEAVRYGYTILNQNANRYFKISAVLRLNLIEPKPCPHALPFGIFGSDAEITFDLFDTYGNVVQSTTKDGRVTTFLWGYGGRYVVAKIVGKSFNDVKNIVGSGLFNGNTLIIDNLNEYVCELLRTNSQCFVTTYIYKPYVGIISQTDPAGRKTFYEYDNVGRLITIRDEKNIRVESYDYHFGISNP